MNELGANLGEQILGNDRFIERIVQKDASLAQRILAKILDLIDAFRTLGNKEARAEYKRLRTAEKLYMEAMEKAGVKYKLGQIEKLTEQMREVTETEENPRNMPIIKIEQNNELTERIKKSDKSKYDVIREFLIDKFSGHIFTMSDGRRAMMDKRDAKKLSNKANNPRIAQLGNLKQLVEEAVYDHSATNVDHKKFIDFHYYNVTAEYDGEIYDLWINVGVSKYDGENHIYAITNKEEVPTNNGVARPVGNALQSTSSTNSIPEKSENVNTKSQFSLKPADEELMRETARRRVGANERDRCASCRGNAW